MSRKGICIPALASGLLIIIVSCSPYSIRNIFNRADDTTTVRVLISKTREHITITSDGDINLSDTDASASRSLRGWRFECDPHNVRNSISINTSKPPLSVNGNPYRGSIVLHMKNGYVYIVNILKMDEYLQGVVPCEIPSGWEIEALKAQAVAARTYAYYHLTIKKSSDSLFDLDATTNSQVYRGVTDEKDRTNRAVIETSGEIITYNSRPIISYFHSTCGGKTIDDKYVWRQSDLEYLKGVSCVFCENSTKFTWESELTLDEVRSCISKKYRGVGKITNISFKRKNDRVTDVIIQHNKGKIAISGNNFRLLFPSEKMRSLYFISRKKGSGLILSGHGWGHGVGMCQWGARGMALRGFGYHEIVYHYYSGVKISEIRNHSIAFKK
jgi:stage II sporulation protein D